MLISQDRQFIGIKIIRDYLDKWIVNANKSFSQRFKTHNVGGD